jgi:hypothetical protein
VEGSGWILLVSRSVEWNYKDDDTRGVVEGDTMSGRTESISGDGLELGRTKVVG